MPAIAPGKCFVRKLRGAVIIHLLLIIDYSVVAESKPLIAASTAYQHKVADLILEEFFNCHQGIHLVQFIEPLMITTFIHQAFEQFEFMLPISHCQAG